MKNAMLVTIIALFATLGQAAEDPLTVHLAGTSIQTVPSRILVVTSNPEESADKFAKRTGLHHSHFGVINDPFRGVQYLFVRPSNLVTYGIDPKHNENLLPEGTVIYRFLMPNQVAREAFLKHYGIKEKSKVEHADHLYQQQEGHLAQILANVGRVFSCAMHPQIRKQKPGKCPICSMDLTEMDDYK